MTNVSISIYKVVAHLWPVTMAEKTNLTELVRFRTDKQMKKDVIDLSKQLSISVAEVWRRSLRMSKLLFNPNLTLGELIGNFPDLEARFYAKEEEGDEEE